MQNVFSLQVLQRAQLNRPGRTIQAVD